MVRLLEANLGSELFRRDRGKLVLNDAGEILLAQVRDAMRQVDDAVEAIRGTSARGLVRVSASESGTLSHLLPAVQALATEQAELRIHIVSLPATRVRDRLMRGVIDVALLEGDAHADGLTVERFGFEKHGVYCGASHPLASRANVTIDECLAHPFAAPVRHAHDRWPAHLPRKVGLRVPTLGAGLAACATGRWLALLPDDVAPQTGLVRLGVGVLAEAPRYVASRSGKTNPRVTVLLDALRAVSRRQTP
jgi:DNA-binding transcriptional LysR family regulator